MEQEPLSGNELKLSTDELRMAVSYLLDQAARLSAGAGVDAGAIRLLKNAATKAVREYTDAWDEVSKALTVELQDAVAKVYVDLQNNPTIDLRNLLRRIVLTGGARLSERYIEALVVTPDYIRENRGPVESACARIAEYKGLTWRTMFNWRSKQPNPVFIPESVDQVRVVLEALWDDDGTSGIGKEMLVLARSLDRQTNPGPIVAPPPARPIVSLGPHELDHEDEGNTRD